ncbi:MFS transporter [Embleya hyalina]|uniref:Putative actinorhodin transporter n=1 Tax=Embleya hyalina TaxID=516124 RepID=A0A401YWJ5_9ACTN|nr:MFS transporter [Embleya hyalina]GCD98987.1 putative actinorhodin transporter [Embleya hyalina]
MEKSPEISGEHTLATPSSPSSRPVVGPRQRWLGLLVVLAATLMNLLDSSVVGVAAPAIRRDLGGGYSSLQWIAAGYTLALAVGLLTGARLGDMYGRRFMLMVGVVGFVALSVACAAAWSPQTLIVARVLQGLFGALMIPQTFGLLRDLFPPAELGKAFAVFGPAIGLSTVLGPIVAGVLVDGDVFGTGWRMIFLINLPLGAFALFVGGRVLPKVAPSEPGGRLDVVGMVLAGVGTFMLVHPLVQGRELGWPLWSLIECGASLPVLAGFAVYQLRRQAAGRAPLIRLGVFRRRSYASGVGFVMVFFGAIVGISMAIGLFLQLGLGYTPTRASLTMGAWAVGAFVGSGFSGVVMGRLGRRILHIGLTVMAAGTGWLYLVFRQAETGLGSGDLLGPLAVFGLGMGMIFVPVFDIIMGEVEDHEVGSASGALESLQQLGASLGIAVLGTVFFGVIGAQATHNFDTSAAPRLRAEMSLAGVPTGTQDSIVTGLRACLDDRENATDPDTVPASCRTLRVPPAATAAVAEASADTHTRSSLDAIRRTTLLALALTAVAFALGFLLPKRARENQLAEATPESLTETREPALV